MDRSGPDSMLAFQNSKLKAQLEVKRDEFADLDRRHQQLLSKQASYQDNLLIVDRLWKQVNGDIHLLAERATGSPAGRTHAFTLQRHSKADYDSFEDPFLERLLQSDPTLHSATQQSLKSLQSDASELELALRKKLSGTVESFARVLDEIRKGQQHRAELAQQIETQLLPDSASAVTTKQLADNVHSLQITVDSQQAYIRTLEANLAQTDDEFVRHKEQIRDMNNQLADLDEQLAKARKLQRAMNGQHPAIAPKIEPNQPNGVTSASSGSQLQEGAAKQTFMLTKSLEETEQLLSKRDIELEQEREAGFALAREVRDLKSQLSSQVSQPVSQNMQGIQRERDIVKADRGRLLARVSQLERDVTRMEAIERQKSSADRDAQHARGMQEASGRVVHDLEVKIKQLQSQFEQSQQALHAVKAQYGQQETLMQTQQHMDKLQSDLASERQKVTKLSSKSQEVAKAKQDVLLATKALQAKEKQIGRLQLKLQRQQSAIEDIEALKVKSEDLRVFVEVLQKLNPEPADMVQLRASEAQLRSKLAKLQADAVGHPLQHTLKQLQQAEVLGSDLQARAVHTADELASQKDLLQVEVDALRQEMANVKEQLTEQQGDNAALMTEIDNTSEAYESMQSSNTGLVQQLGERDARISQLTGEQLRHDQALARGKADRELAETASRAAQQHKQGLEQRVQDVQTDLQAVHQREDELQDQLHSCNASLAQTKREKEELGISLQERSLQLADLQREAADKKRALDSECEKLSREKHKRQRIEEDNKAMHSKLEQAHQPTGKDGLTHQAAEELEGLRALLRCNVCHERQKNVIITKCMHMFCKTCIQRNIDARHRKCPGCGAAFGTKDVQQFFFT